MFDIEQELGKPLPEDVKEAIQLLFEFAFFIERPIFLAVSDAKTDRNHSCLCVVFGNEEKTAQVSALALTWEAPGDLPPSVSESPDSQSPQ